MNEINCPVCDKVMAVWCAWEATPGVFTNDLDRCTCGVVKHRFFGWSIPGIADLVSDTVIEQVRDFISENGRKIWNYRGQFSGMRYKDLIRHFHDLSGE